MGKFQWVFIQLMCLFAYVFVWAGPYGVCSLSDMPIGFASLEGGTTGGAGGTTVTATTADELKGYMDSNDKLVIQVSGAITLSGMTPLRGNKTLIGLGNNAQIIKGGLEIYKRDNIIIRNITFVDSPDDCLKVNQNTTHLWVDHCTFTDGDLPDPEGANHDGLFDITRQSNYITISYCLFINHSKSILIGHSDGASSDVGYLKTTMHHNWFKATRQRHPRVRYAEVHCFNNFYDSNDLYGIASTCEADVMVEGNYFLNDSFPTYCGYAESPAGDILERNNEFVNSGKPQTRGTAFEPSKYYSYTLDKATDVPSIVKNSAGAGSGSTPNKKPQIQSPIVSGEQFVFTNSSSGLSALVSLTRDAVVQIVLYDALGRETGILFDGYLSKGKQYAIKVNNKLFPDGLYIAVLRSGTLSVARRVVISGIL